MSDSDATLGDVDKEEEYPAMEVDMRLFSIYVKGNSDDTLEEVEETINRQVETRLEEVKGMKRHDQELAEEFAADGSSPSGNRYSQ